MRLSKIKLHKLYFCVPTLCSHYFFKGKFYFFSFLFLSWFCFSFYNTFLYIFVFYFVLKEISTEVRKKKALICFLTVVWISSCLSQSLFICLSFFSLYLFFPAFIHRPILPHFFLFSLLFNFFLFTFHSFFLLLFSLISSSSCKYNRFFVKYDNCNKKSLCSCDDCDDLRKISLVIMEYTWDRSHTKDKVRNKTLRKNNI